MTTKKPVARSKCPHCKELVRVGSDLRLVKHQATIETFRGRRRVIGQHCVGSGESRALELLDEARREALYSRFLVEDLVVALEAERAEAIAKTKIADNLAKKAAASGALVPSWPDDEEMERRREQHNKDYPMTHIRVFRRAPTPKDSAVRQDKKAT